MWTSHAKLPTRAVFLNRHGVGVPVRVTGQAESVTGNEYEEHVHRMMIELRRDRRPRGLMIVVHGGLNSFGASREFAEQAGDGIYAADYNPIFLNWQTNLVSSYGEHLFWTRRGHIVTGEAATVNAPFNLVADVGRGVSRWPINVTESLRDDLLTFGADRSYPVMAEYQAVRAGFGNPAQVQVSLGTYCKSTTGQLATALGLPFLPFRLALGLPLSEMGGTSGWNNMLRRTRNVFRQPVESAHRDVAYGEQYKPGQGGASILMDSLQGLLREDTTRRVTLIGHSMGAIVLNEVIRLYPTIRYDTIVYMAAAASTRDVYESVLPYLASHPETRFYSLTLHPNADAGEHMLPLVPVLPVGSLLEAIDDIYQQPATHVDRVFGKWTNVMETLHLIPDSIRGQVTIKGFGFNDPNHPGYGPYHRQPAAHGDFNDVKLQFWRSEFWEPPATARPGDPDPRGCTRS